MSVRPYRLWERGGGDWGGGVGVTGGGRGIASFLRGISFKNEKLFLFVPSKTDGGV